LGYFLVEAIYVGLYFSPFLLIAWAWIRVLKSRGNPTSLGRRFVLGRAALWLVTVQLLAGLAVFVFALRCYEFPRNVEIWMSWSRAAFIMTAVAILLSLIGQTRARWQILFGTLAIALVCVMIASLA
jgi:hypothetical protein